MELDIFFLCSKVWGVMDLPGTESRDPQLNLCSKSAAMQEWEKLKEEGGKFYKASQWAEAIDCYSKAIDLNPSAAVLYSNRALCHLRLSDFARAREDAENAIKFDSKVIKYYRTLSLALQELKLHRHTAEACKAGLELDPSDEVLLSRLKEIQKLSAAGGHQAEKNPGNFSFVNFYENIDFSFNDSVLANLKGKDKKYAQELDNFFPPFEVPRDTPVVEREELRCLLSDLKGRAERGSVTARRYLRAYEQVLDAGFDAFYGKDVHDSFRRYRQAKKVWDEVPVMPRMLAKFNELAQEAFQQNPKDAGALHVLVLSEACIAGGNYKAFISKAKMCVTLEPSIPDFQVTLGLAYYDADEYENAVKCFDRALELERSPQVLFYKGRALALMKRSREAIACFEQYIEEGENDEPDMPMAFYLLVHHCSVIGLLAEADEYWKRGQESEELVIKLPFYEGYGSLKVSVHELLIRRRASIGGCRSFGATPRGCADTGISDLKCGACGKTAKNLSRCGRCKSVQYCGRACQQKHWPLHKKSCKKT